MPDARILVIGGTGAVGRIIVDDLLRSVPGATVAVASRKPGDRGGKPGVVPIALDVADRNALLAACRDRDLVIVAAGPFGGFGARVHRACLEAGVDCVDINDSETAAREIMDLDGACRERGVRMLTGMGLTPGLTGWMLRRLARRDGCVAREYMARLYMGARHGGGAASPDVLIDGFRSRMPALRDGRTQMIRTPWTGERSSYRFPGAPRPLPLIPFPSPEAVTLPMGETAKTLGIRSLDHRYHIQFMPRMMARLLAATGFAGWEAGRASLARMFHRQGSKLQHKPDASEITSVVVAPADAPDTGLMIHGPISSGYLTASFAVVAALALLQDRKRVSPGVHAAEALEIEDDAVERALARRGIIVTPVSEEPGDYRAELGHSSPSTGEASSLRHYGKCWYSFETIPPDILRRQQRCLKTSRLWREARARMSAVALAMLMWRVQKRHRRYAKRLLAQPAFITDDGIRRKVLREFALFAAGYTEARMALGEDARELYSEMFLDSGAMEMAWLWPSAAVIAASDDPYATLCDYVIAYFAESERLGVLGHKIVHGRDGTIGLTVTKCGYATLFETLECDELGNLVREMEFTAISALANAIGVQVNWTAGSKTGTGMLRLSRAYARGVA